MRNRIELIGVPGIPEVAEGDDVAALIARALRNAGIEVVAGDVLVKNERLSKLARLQAWDYMLGIASVKRQQSMFHGTLVAPGIGLSSPICLKVSGFLVRSRLYGNRRMPKYAVLGVPSARSYGPIA